MNKFGSAIEEDFETVRDVIRRMIGASHELILARSLTQERNDFTELAALSARNINCLRSLSFPEQEQRYKRIETATQTCKWLLEDPEYRAWMNKSRGLFWIKGNPGAGKSVLMKFAVAEMLRRQPRGLVVSFFIHGQGTDLQKTPLGIYRALLNSMLEYFPQYLSQLTEMFEDRQKRLGAYTAERWEWTDKELQDFLFDVLTAGSKHQPVVIFIDALDECGEGGAKSLLTYFKDLMEDVESKGSQVKICVSSRHYPILGVNTIPTISVEERNHEDIRLVIQRRLREIEPRRERNQIQEAILSRAQGGFQWAVLVTSLVLDGNATGQKVDKLLEKTQSLPQALGPRYSTEPSIASSIKSRPETSVFDRDDNSRGTYPSTMPTSQPYHKPAETLPLIQSQESSNHALPMNIRHEDGIHKPVHELSNEDEHPHSHDDFDAQTTYSIDPLLDDSTDIYLQIFADRLQHDTEQLSGEWTISDMPPSCLEQTLRAFAWQLHAESSNPFQWETSLILHSQRKMILRLLGATEQPSSEEDESDENHDRPMFQKPPGFLAQWLDEVGTSNPAPAPDQEVESVYSHPESLFKLHEHESFILQSEAYSWLLSKIKQHATMSVGSKLSELSQALRDKFKTQHSLRIISHRRPSPSVRLSLELDWSPLLYLSAQESPSPFDFLVRHLLCITGSWREAQATTIEEYVAQTWPITGNATLEVFRALVSIPEGHEASSSPRMPKTVQVSARMQNTHTCHVLLSGAPYLVTEIVEQIGWLASALYSPGVAKGMLLRHPRIDNLEVKTTTADGYFATITTSCRMGFETSPIAETSESTTGLCWTPLFRNHVIVSGYPIPRRPISNTGLELSLRSMTCLVRSQQIVQWGERIIMKGFNALAIATFATTSVLVWHLIRNPGPDERVSYVDLRLDQIQTHLSHGFSLRDVEGKRHIIGWCSEATDFCGHATANHNISASGLLKTPSSIVIDRLYLEGGSSVVGGMNMNFNKKEKSFWLHQESDYPRLLKWVGLQPFIFYDVSDRRAWLLDGLSALLHLTRISLHLDQIDDESPYEWVFDAAKLKDTWDGCSGRLAALKTLKDWDNLRMNVYVKDGSNRNDLQYEKLGERVERLLHSIEIIVDRQVKVAQQDGIRISQTLDPRRGVVGFDILDIVAPLGPIDARIQRLDMLGCGWIDLVPPIGATTIFGKGFGELIRPKDSNSVCGLWKTVPVNNDYLAASLSTLKMLYDRRLQRMEPGLGIGEMTSKILWSSPNPPFAACQCLNNTAIDEIRHSNPVQFLISKKMQKMNSLTKRANLVDLIGLGEKGAVVFGHLTIPGRKKGTNVAGVIEPKDDDVVLSVGECSGSKTTSNLSGLGSSTTQPTTSTNITTPNSEGAKRSDVEGSRRKNIWRKISKWK
ncbi:hypothetical protein GQ44DRAFT_119407 [Phaeosphaeriaceae sp. PMI808]|nr:hypothetical protein GQ44DRAFT_119407 [Phaeosphaeriaceae sp. PMI808]